MQHRTHAPTHLKVVFLSLAYSQGWTRISLQQQRGDSVGSTVADTVQSEQRCRLVHDATVSYLICDTSNGRLTLWAWASRTYPDLAPIEPTRNCHVGAYTRRGPTLGRIALWRLTYTAEIVDDRPRDCRDPRGEIGKTSIRPDVLRRYWLLWDLSALKKALPPILGKPSLRAGRDSTPSSQSQESGHWQGEEIPHLAFDVISFCRAVMVRTRTSHLVTCALLPKWSKCLLASRPFPKYKVAFSAWHLV